MNDKRTTISAITKEIYGPRIVEILQQETYLSGQMGSSKPYVRKIPERKCTEDDLEIWSSDYSETSLVCTNCHEQKDIGFDIKYTELKESVANFKHWPKS